MHRVVVDLQAGTTTEVPLTDEEVKELAERAAASAVGDFNATILAQLAAIDSASGANRGIRELALSFAALCDHLALTDQKVPVTSGNAGIVKIAQAEALAAQLRARLLK